MFENLIISTPSKNIMDFFPVTVRSAVDEDDIIVASENFFDLFASFLPEETASDLIEYVLDQTVCGQYEFLHEEDTVVGRALANVQGWTLVSNLATLMGSNMADELDKCWIRAIMDSLNRSKSRK